MPENVVRNQSKPVKVSENQRQPYEANRSRPKPISVLDLSDPEICVTIYIAIISIEMKYV